MSIRSVDLAVLYTKTSDVEKAQQMQQHQERVTHDQVAQDTSQKRVEKERQVVSTPRSEGGRIEDRPERRRGKRQGKGRPSENEEVETETAEMPLEKMAKIDIRI